MDQHIRKVYVPMTETAFYILFCLREENHGYGVVQRVEKLTDGAIRLAPGTMYGSLSKMEKDGVIRFIREEDKRKIYKITPLGEEVLALEIKRIERLYKIAKGETKRKTKTTSKSCSGISAYLNTKKRKDFSARCINRVGNS